MSDSVRVSFGIRVTLLALAVSLPLFAETAPQPAAPPTRETCIASHARSQELRIDSKLIDAREKLRVCSNPACPGALRTDCGGWLAEVEQQIPSVTLSVWVDGEETTAVHVSLDHEPLTETLDGSVYELDPGAHTFRFEVPGYPPRQQLVVLRQFEKRRVVRVDFRKEAPPAPAAAAPPPPPATAPGPAAPPGKVTRPIPVASWMFAGVAVGAAAASIYLGVDGLKTNSEKEDRCAPNCDDADVRKIKSQLLLADIAGSAAVVSAGIAVYLYLTRPEVVEQPPSAWAERIRVSLAPGGAGLSMNGSF